MLARDEFFVATHGIPVGGPLPAGHEIPDTVRCSHRRPSLCFPVHWDVLAPSVPGNSGRNGAHARSSLMPRMDTSTSLADAEQLLISKDMMWQGIGGGGRSLVGLKEDVETRGRDPPLCVCARSKNPHGPCPSALASLLLMKPDSLSSHQWLCGAAGRRGG